MLNHQFKLLIDLKMQKHSKKYLVENSKIDFIEETTVLEFKIDSNELQKIISEKMFNYKEEIFLETLTPILNQGT